MPNSLLDPPFRKPAPAGAPIHSLLIERWSPRAFSPEPLSADTLRLLFEAARWAPSASNEQPWSFVVATRDRPVDFERLLGCLNPGNRAWAAHAPALMVAGARLMLAGKPQPNRNALYDLGQAVAHFTFQATALGLAVHQMAGVDLDAARAACAMPDEHAPVVAVAFGHPAATDTLPEDVRRKDQVPRTRKPLADFVFDGRWGRALER